MQVQAVWHALEMAACELSMNDNIQICLLSPLSVSGLQVIESPLSLTQQ